MPAFNRLNVFPLRLRAAHAEIKIPEICDFLSLSSLPPSVTPSTLPLLDASPSALKWNDPAVINTTYKNYTPRVSFEAIKKSRKINF